LSSPTAPSISRTAAPAKALLVGLNMKPGGSVQGTVKIGARGKDEAADDAA